MSRIGLGLSSEAWLVSDGARRSVLRLALEGLSWPSTYRAEHVILAALAAHGGPVPEPISGSWEIATWQGAPWSLTSYAAGSPLRASSRVSAAPAIGAFVELLRSVPVDGFGPVNELASPLRGVAEDPRSGLLAWMDGDPFWPFDGTRLRDHPALHDLPDLARTLETQVERIEAAAHAGPMALVHADLHEENILEDGRRLAFIDFGEAFIGSADWEPATLAYFMGWELADQAIGAVGSNPGGSAALGLSFGVHRWRQDRRLGLDEDDYDESFLRSTLARLAGPDVDIAAIDSSRT
ncbi:MAG TPA: aminoglycoside phosphotransferase family protein [Candidatus Limnocylindrales bacterium]